MGELFVRINLPHGEVKKIEPIERKLVACEDYDQDWNRWRGLTIDNVLHREHGGLILGEGDSGKSTFVKMLAERAEEHRPIKILRLARDSIKAEQIQNEVDEIGRRSGILILDGLDEKQELRYDIAEICERSHNCAIWVTSRPCDAATHLQTNCEMFEKPFRLMDFSDEDIRLIAARVGVDYTPFIKALRTAGLESFISKPGGTILMLCKYLNRERGPDLIEYERLNMLARQSPTAGPIISPHLNHARSFVRPSVRTCGEARPIFSSS